jgi:gamma-polyglutamate biosynthesis protein CapA
MFEKLRIMRSSEKVTIMAVGDIMLGELPTCYGFGVGSMIDKYGPAFPFEHCAAILNQADIACGNLETVISAFDKKTDPFARTVLRAQPAAVDGLAGAGFKVLTLANNHIMQHGRKALAETIELLRSSGIKITGLEIPENNIENLVVINIRDAAISFLGYNQRPQQYFLDPPLYVNFDLDRIRDDIAAARKKSNWVVVSVHWGEEFVDRPSSEQIDWAHRIADFGADIILGHHSHTVQGIENYKGKIIAYSLGNFVFDMWQKRLQETMILKIVITPESKLDYAVLPVVINAKYQPVMAELSEKDRLQEYISKISNDLKTSIPDSEYESIVRKELERYRIEVYRHYLANVFRFDPRFLMKNLYGAIRRRLVKAT